MKRIAIAILAVLITVGCTKTKKYPIPLFEGLGGELNSSTSSTTVGGSTSNSTATSVSDVGTSSTSGTYNVGDTVTLVVTFVESVDVSGTPTLTLNNGATATYSSGSGGTTLTFTYTIQAGDDVSSLNYAGTDSLNTNDGTNGTVVVSGTTTAADTTLPDPGATTTSISTASIQVDTGAPTVTSVQALTTDGTYKVGDTILVSVKMSELVNVTGTPLLNMATGGTASYVSGSGSDTLVFQYTIPSGANTSDLNYVDTSSLVLNGGTIQDASNNDADRTLPDPTTGSSIATNSAIQIAPAVSSVASSTGNGPFNAGDTISIEITYDQNITLDTSGGTPTLTLNLPGSPTATCSTVTGSNTLVCTYTVQSGDNVSDLDYIDTSSLVLNGATIKGSSGVDAVNTLPDPSAGSSLASSNQIVVDTTGPTATAIAPHNTSDGLYANGSTIYLKVTMDEATVIDTTGGTPRVRLSNGSYATYVSGSGSTELIFQYNVTTGDTDSFDLTHFDTTAFETNGGTVRDAAGNDATRTLPDPAATGGFAETYAIVVQPDAAVVSFDTSNLTYNENAGTVTIPVTISKASASAVTVTASVSGGTATSGTDYTAPSGTVTFAAGSTTASGSITLAITDDDLDEVATETIILDMNVTNAAKGGTVTYNITDNDATPTLNIASSTYSVAEGSSQTLTFSLTSKSASDVSFNLATADGTAVGGTDYTAISQTVTIPAGSTSTTVDLSTTQDTTDENDETLTATISSVSVSGAPSPSTGTTSSTITITDNDAEPTVTIGAATYTVAEGASINIPVNLSAASGKTITVPYTITNGTASAADHNGGTSGTLTFTPGQTTQNISITATGDTLDEVDETFTIAFGSVTNASTTGQTTSSTVTITDDDNPPTVTMGAASYNVNEGASLDIPVTLSTASGKDVTIPYTITNVSAESGDYTDTTTGSITISAGSTTANIQIAAATDDIDEDTETMTVAFGSLTNGSNGTTTSSTVSIIDQTTDVTLSFVSTTATLSEGQTSGQNLTIQLSGKSEKTYTYTVTGTGGTATSGSDYTAIALTGQTLVGDGTTANQSVSIPITALDDSVYEGGSGGTKETYNVVLGGDASGTATVSITDTDTAPAISITASGLSSGSTGSINEGGTITYTVSYPSGVTNSSAVAVPVAITGSSTFKASDYTLNGVSGGNVTIPAGQNSVTFTVDVATDDIDEPDETITATLSAPSGYSLGTGSSTGTITDTTTDVTLGFSSSTASINEGASGQTLTLALSGKSEKTYTYSATSTAGTATEGSDYTAISVSNATLVGSGSAGQTATIAINATADSSYEGGSGGTAETYTVNVTSDVSGTTASTVSIVDQDSLGTIALSVVSGLTSDTTTEAGGAITYRATLSGGQTSTNPITIDVALTGTTSSADYATSGISSNQITIPAGQTTVDFTIDPSTDDIDENDETVIVTLSNPSEGSLGTATHTATITDTNTDVTLAFAASSVTVSEGATATINAQLSGKTTKTFNFTATSTAGTATEGSDYTAISQAYSIVGDGSTANQTTAVTVNASNDTIYEGGSGGTAETYTLGFTSVSGGSTSGQTTATVNITDTDSAPTISFTAGGTNTVGEGAGNYSLSFSIDQASSSDITFTINTSNGTATGGSDFTAQSSVTVTIPAGSTTASVNIPITDDATYEGNETFTVTMSGASGGTLSGTTSQTVTITDNDIGITSASTLDTDNDGKIDHYKVIFTEAVTDSSFDAAKWAIAGYSGDAINTATTIGGESNTANDNTIYISFTEGGSYDTGAKPDLTTSASGAITPASGSNTLGTQGTAAITEADTAKPVVVSATGTEGSTALTVTYSEPVYTNTGSSGAITTADVTYANGSSGDATAVASMGADTDGSDNTVIYTVDVAFASADSSDTVAGNTSIYDAADNTGNTTAKNLTISTNVPVITISSITISDGSTKGSGVDSDDYVEFVFSAEFSNHTEITTSTLANFFSISNSNSWGTPSSITWVDSSGSTCTPDGTGTDCVNMRVNYGSGATIAANDVVTITANGGTELQNSGGIVSTGQTGIVTGTFDADYTQPYMVIATDITATGDSTSTILVKFSENMYQDATGTSDDTKAGNLLANYTLATTAGSSVNLADGDSIVKVDDSTYKIVLNELLTSGTEYKLTAASTMEDQSANTMTDPRELTFIADDEMRILSAVATGTNTVDVYFSRLINTTSGVCANATACNSVYYLGPGSDGTSRITITSATVSLNVATLTLDSATFAGRSYTVIGANGDTTDNGNVTFTDSTAISDSTGGKNLAANPKDRISFMGTGTIINTFAEGWYMSDPFLDGSVFAYTFNFKGKVFVGPNVYNNTTLRFNPDGSNVVGVLFGFANSTTESYNCGYDTSTGLSSASGNWGFGYETSYSSNTDCAGTDTTGPKYVGPRKDIGVAGFTSGQNSDGSEFLLVGTLRDNATVGFYTQDTDNKLDMRSFDAVSFTGGANTRSAQMFYTNGTTLYSGYSTASSTQSPILVSSQMPTGTTITDFPGGNETGAENMNTTQADVLQRGSEAFINSSDPLGIDALIVHKNYLYASSSTGLAATVDLTGGFTAGGGKDRFAGKASVTPDFSTASTSVNTLVLPGKTSASADNAEGLLKVSPGQKGIPFLKEHNSKLYMVRNVSQGSTNTSDTLITELNKLPSFGEVYVCGTPTGTVVHADGNGTNYCQASDWTKLFTTEDSTFRGKTASCSAQGDSTSCGNVTGCSWISSNSTCTAQESISMIETTPTGIVYIGVDSPQGFRVYRNNVGTTSDLPASSGWSQLGTDGLGSGYTHIQSSTVIKGNPDVAAGSGNDDKIYYTYITTGKWDTTNQWNVPIKVFRQGEKDTTELTTFLLEKILPEGQLLAYASANGRGVRIIAMIGLLALVILAGLYIRKRLQYTS